jgi:hypothetical protein
MLTEVGGGESQVLLSREQRGLKAARGQGEYQSELRVFCTMPML